MAFHINGLPVHTKGEGNYKPEEPRGSMNDVAAYAKGTFDGHKNGLKILARVSENENLTKEQKLVVGLLRLNLEIAYTKWLKIKDLYPTGLLQATCKVAYEFEEIMNSKETKERLTQIAPSIEKRIRINQKKVKELLVEDLSLAFKNPGLYQRTKELRTERLFIFSKIDEATRLIQYDMQQLDKSIRKEMYMMKDIFKKYEESVEK